MDASAIHVDGKMCGLAAVPNPFGDQSVIPALPDEYEAYAAMVLPTSGSEGILEGALF